MAELEEAEPLAHRAVLCHVAPRLPHQPDRRVRHGLAPARREVGRGVHPGESYAKAVAESTAAYPSPPSRRSCADDKSDGVPAVVVARIRTRVLAFKERHATCSACAVGRAARTGEN